MKKVLFIDRDGTILKEPQDEQIDSFEKFSFVDKAISTLSYIKKHTNFMLVMVSNQDGLGTASFREEDFWPIQNLMLDVLKSEGITFDAIHIDRSFKKDNSPMRKPGIGMLKEYLNEKEYDLSSSYVIGDRESDKLLAKNLGCQYLFPDWDNVKQVLSIKGARKAKVKRKTLETDISIELDLDGQGNSLIDTGLGFFDHMLSQIAHHGNIDLSIKCKGDLKVDSHHTIEDVGIALGEALLKALGDKRAIERYGYTLPMDDCLCQVALDFGGRPWLVWDVKFQREKVGDVPTEMIEHFFKSLSDSAKMNINIKARGHNAHHKIEGIFKATAKAIKMAVRRDVEHQVLPSSKGVL
ncbi:MAG: bifunctional histidinol-phosphatase/imidazoleglycerol-phosphate dehydratase HisB [Prevotella sp.]|nr:bifunctional histidinol-phosphatase/imidazoleglycerol-phosphate dehydratase HisB [Prevotella sp.]